MRPAPLRAAGILGLCLSCVGPWAEARAQEPLATGREARIFVRGVAGAFEGRLLGVSAASVTVALENGSAFTLQAAQIDRAEILGTKTNLELGAAVGGGVGIGVGVWWAVASRDDCRNTSGYCADSADHFKEWRLVVPALAGVAAGGLVGHFIRSPNWVPAFLPGGPSGDDAALGLVWRLPVGAGTPRHGA